MTESLHLRAGEVFLEARGLPDAERASYLDRACEGRPELREAVDRLLQHDSESATGFLGEDELGGERERLERWLDESDGPDGRPIGIPERIGAYRVVRQVGMGGMGVVYEAEQTSPRRRVALKVVHPLMITRDRVLRFEREASVLGRLSHPGIAKVHEAGTFDVGSGPQPYFSMEFVDGVDLRTFADREGLDTRSRARLVAAVADAVHHAHEAGFVHRDLKPENVLVTEAGQPVVLDFGIARITGESPTLATALTEEGRVLGTLAYMAPEQLGAGEVDGRADVYALGVMLFELLAGHPPFQLKDLSLSAALRAVTVDEPQSLGAVVPSLRGDLSTIVGKAIDPERGRRYASASALAADLRAFLEHRPVAARPPSRAYQLRRFSRRHRGLVAGAATTFATLLAGLAIALVLADRESRQRAVAEANERRMASALLGQVQQRLEDDAPWDAARIAATIDPELVGWAGRFVGAALPEVAPYATLHWDWVGDEHLACPAPDGVGGLVVRVEDWAPAARIGPGLAVRPEPRSHGALWWETTGARRLLEFDPFDGALVAEWLSDVEGARAATVDGAGRIVALVANRDDGARLTLDGARVANWPEHRRTGTFISRTGRRAALYGHGGRLWVVDVATGRISEALEGLPKTSMIRCRFRGDDELLLWTENRSPFTVDVDTLEIAEQFDFIPRASNGSGDLSTDGTRFARIEGGHLEVWDLEARAIARRIPMGESTHRAVHLSPDGSRALVGVSRVAHALIDLEDPFLGVRPGDHGSDPRVTTFEGHDSWVYDVAVSPDGRTIASLAPRESCIRLWDSRTGEPLVELERRWDAGVLLPRDTLLAFSGDGRRLVATTPLPGASDRVVVWDLLSGEVEQHAPEKTEDGLDWSGPLERLLEVAGDTPDGRLGRATQIRRGGAFVLETTTTREAAWGSGWGSNPPTMAAQGLALDDDAERAAITDPNLTVVRDLDSGRVLYSSGLPSHSAAWSPDGRTLAFGGVDGRIKLVDGELLVEQLSFPAHDDYVFSLAWTPDGTRLVSASGDGTVRVWDARPREVRESTAYWDTLVDAARRLEGDPDEHFAAARGIDERAAIVRAALAP